MNLKQAVIRAEQVLGRIDLDPASDTPVVQDKVTYRPHEGVAAFKDFAEPVTVWLDPPRHTRSGIPYDVLHWKALMEARRNGLLRHGVFIKRGAMVTTEVERPSLFLSCWAYPTPPSRYNIPTFRDEPQIIYIPGLTDASETFKRSFKDFGDLLQPIYRSKS